MPPNSINLLLIEDNPAQARLLQEFVKGTTSTKFLVVQVKRLQEALSRLHEQDFDVILLDLRLPDSQGLASLKPLMAKAPSLPIVVLTNTNDNDLAVEAVRQGAQDFLVKQQVNAELLVRSLCYAIERKQGQEALQKAKDELEMRVARRTAQLAEANELLKAASRAKSEFLTNMSHDLRTPLNAILGIAQILQRSTTMTVEELENINIIYQSGDHLLNLIEGILDLSKIEAGKMELYLAEFRFPDFLRGVVEICRVSAEQKGIALKFQPGSQLPDVVCADRKRLRQVLLNLLGNAIKFTNKGGVTFKVEMICDTLGYSAGQKIVADEEANNRASFASHLLPSHCPRINSDRQSDSSSCQRCEASKIAKIRFQIEDTGVGMTSEQLEQIFLPFEQVGSRRSKSEGTGLGLAISDSLIKLMNSQLQVESKPGVGSVFWMDLELCTVPIIANSTSSGQDLLLQPDESLKQPQPLRILLAEDTPVNQKVALKMLEKLGYTADVANNGKEVLELLHRQSYDVVLMDVQMPEMDGLEATRQICRQWLTTERPYIVAMTANAMPEDREKCMAAGMDDYISKPFRVEAIAKVLRQCKTAIGSESLQI